MCQPPAISQRTDFCRWFNKDGGCEAVVNDTPFGDAAGRCLEGRYPRGILRKPRLHAWMRPGKGMRCPAGLVLTVTWKAVLDNRCRNGTDENWGLVKRRTCRPIGLQPACNHYVQDAKAAECENPLQRRPRIDPVLTAALSTASEILTTVATPRHISVSKVEKINYTKRYGSSLYSFTSKWKECPNPMSRITK